MSSPVLRPLNLRQLLSAPVFVLGAGVSHSYAAEPTATSRLEKLTVEEAVVAPNANPRAQEGAPYKVNELASPLYT
ncbi:MAG TPA: hypothetical protein PKD17_08595, partial [Cellvibrionaceae bacterium]|nr:hypothetical protein [Cellvibrionaceae bacterium]